MQLRCSLLVLIKVYKEFLQNNQSVNMLISIAQTEINLSVVKFDIAFLFRVIMV